MPRIVRYGVDKLANTFLFTGDAQGTVSFLNGGLLTIRQRYNGAVLRSSTQALRDDQALNILGSIPLYDQFRAIVQGLWFSTSDSRSIGLQSASRTGIYGGLCYTGQQVRAEAAMGWEGNSQLGVKAGGFSVYGNADIKPLRLDENLMLQGMLLGNHSTIDDKRVTSDIDSRLFLFSDNEPGSIARFSTETRYKRQNRDFFTPVSGSDSLAIERRIEQRLSISADISSPLSSYLIAGLQFSMEMADIDRLYQQPLLNAPITSINRQLQELSFSINGSIEYNTINGGRHILGISLYSRDEQNAVTTLFKLDPADEEALRRQEFQRDNTAGRLRLSLQSLQPIGKKDSLFLSGSVSLLRYDTPSTLNNDDRDEQVLIAGAAWWHALQPGLSLRLDAGLQYTHLVFIKAQRSSLNNWNRIIRLSPGIDWKNSVIEAHPRFEVLANYTVYDFESLTGDVQSFSFRQASYRDSILINPGDGFQAELKLFARIFDRGLLFWQEFSESPLTHSTEQFAKFLIFTPRKNGIRMGIGARYYQLAQFSLYGTIPAQASLQQNSRTRNYGPELSFTANFASGSSISLQGWYEWQYSNGVLFRTQPNLLLQAAISW